MKGISKFQREILSELIQITGWLGNQLDLTATHPTKLIDRQRSLSTVSNILYGLLMDHPDNEYRKEDVDNLLIAMQKLRDLKAKEYPDRNGYWGPQEKKPLTTTE